MSGIEIRRRSETSTPTSTPTILPTVLGNDIEGQMRVLREVYGVFLEDIASDGAYDYWRDPTFSQRVSLASRVDAVYQVVTYMDSTALRLPNAQYTTYPGERFKWTYGARTVLRYTGATTADNSAAEVVTVLQIRGTGNYAQNLCNTEASIVIREMEADMIMNEILNFFNQTVAEEQARSQWAKEHLYGTATIKSWIQDALIFTLHG
jgi:hypothetical protein